ncbi:MAG TPA: hypothetical protein VJ843_00065 [Candidatus Saccharimonadales bacterium]|nr:hypothetical protein [Candidatus Saccharimonadales bacterium]
MKLADKFKAWMFSAPEGERSTADIVLWWERRRIPYNLLVGAAGICSLLLLYFIVSKTNGLKPGEDVVEPMALLAAPVMMNLCYTGGWVAEVSLRKRWPGGGGNLGPRLLKAGFQISLAVVTIPSAYWGGYWLQQVTGLLN